MRPQSVAAMALFSALAFAAPAFAQSLIREAEGATGTLLEQGVLGAFAVLELVGLAILWLDGRRERKELHAQLEKKDEKMLAIALRRGQEDVEDAKREQRAIRRAMKNSGQEPT